jgi:multidrug transporter EmrE-like cation transporter
MISYLFVAATIALTVYGQLVLKWQVSLAGAVPVAADAKFWFIARLLLKPWVLSGFAAAFLASLCWMAAVSKLDLSHAYPFTSLSFVLVLALSAWLFNEPLSLPKLIGMFLIVAGIAVASQG